jgi:hypothetical protein
MSARAVQTMPGDTAAPEHRPGSVPLRGALVIIGAAAFVFGLFRNPTHAWGMYLVNLLFWSSLAIVGPVLAGVMQLTEARWSPSAKRVAATTAGFLPASFVLLVILLVFGLGDLYPWVTAPELVEKKKQWLNVPFFVLRLGLGTLVLYWLALAFVRSVLAPSPAESRHRESRAGGHEAAPGRLNLHAGIMLTLFVVVFSLWGFDLVMSLDPVWYSGLLGGYYVVTSLYSGFALVTFLTIRANARGLTAVSPAGIQDLAKLVFAMCVMWMYFFFSQYLVIWYGNIPVETRFFLSRFFADPWRTMAFVIFLVGALVPFCYLLKRLTGRPPAGHRPLVVILAMGWVAIFLERTLLVFPAISRQNVFPIGVGELLITLGFLGLFLLSRHWLFARHRPVLDQGR